MIQCIFAWPNHPYQTSPTGTRKRAYNHSRNTKFRVPYTAVASFEFGVDLIVEVPRGVDTNYLAHCSKNIV